MRSYPQAHDGRRRLYAQAFACSPQAQASVCQCFLASPVQLLRLTSNTIHNMKYISYTLRVLLALAVLALPLGSLALFGATQDHAFLLPLCLSFCAALAVTELDKRRDSRLLEWLSRPL